MNDLFIKKTGRPFFLVVVFWEFQEFPTSLVSFNGRLDLFGQYSNLAVFDFPLKNQVTSGLCLDSFIF